MNDTEEIVLLSDDWQPIGSAPKLASHNADTPLHLGFSCHIFNREGKILITRRALGKKVWPGIWTNACCGHPGPGEATTAAIHRRVQYELNFEVKDLREVLPKYRYRCKFNGIIENECCPVYVAQSDTDPEPNPDEVADYRWLTAAELAQQLKSQPDVYSYWCKQQIPLLREQGIAI